MPQRVKVLLAVLTLAAVLLTGCGGQETPVEQAEEEAGVEEIVEEETTEPTQAPPRDAEEAAADEAKAKTAEQAKALPNALPEYQVAEIRPGVAATDLPQATISKVELTPLASVGIRGASRVLSRPGRPRSRGRISAPAGSNGRPRTDLLGCLAALPALPGPATR